MMRTRWPLSLLPRSALLLFGALLGGFSGTPLAAQKEASQKEALQNREKPKPPKWPELSKADKAKGTKWLKLLGSKKPAVQQKAEDQLLALGLGIGDRMFRRMTDSKNRNINERLTAALDKLLKPEHAALIGLHASHKSVFARRYVIKKLAQYGQEDSAGVFRKAQGDKDKEVAYYAALGLVKSKHDTAALDVIFKRCEEEWSDIGEEVGRFLKDIRHKDFMPWIQKRIQTEELTEHLALLRLMRSVATKDAVSMIRRFLDSEDGVLKKEAINALRVIVDGEDPLPLQKMGVFRVIKMAKDWKARI